MSPTVVATKVIENQVGLDKAYIESHNYSEGHSLRRGIGGALSLMFDRTDVAIYPRILDAAVIHATQMEGKMRANNLGDKSCLNFV